MHAMPMADVEIIETHPLLDAINDPNGLMTCYSLLFTLTASLQLTGRAFWWMSKGAGERKGRIDIWPIPTHWVTANHSAGFRTAWKIKPPGSMDGFMVPGEAMAAFCYPDPSDPFGSYAPVEAAARDILTDESIKEAQHRGFDNDVIPGLAFILGDTAIGPDGKPARPQAEPHQIEQLEQRLNQLYRGTSKSRRFILLDRLIKDVKQISVNPSEMDFMGSGKMVKSAIMQIFGVNPIIAGEVEGANRASATVAQDIVDDNVINPTIAMITQTINKSVVPIFSEEGENIIAWIEEASAIDPAERRASWELGQRMRAVTRDEYRAEVLGLPPLPNDEGESFAMGISEIIEPVGEGLPEPQVDDDDDSGSSHDDDDDDDDDSERRFRRNGNGRHKESSRWDPALMELDQPLKQPLNVNITLPAAVTPPVPVINIETPEIKMPDVYVNPEINLDPSINLDPQINIEPKITIVEPEKKDALIPDIVIEAPIVNVEAPDIIITPNITVTPADVMVPPPVVNVSPTVNVESPIVNVESPTVNVNPSINIPAPEVNVTVEQPDAKPKEVEFRRDAGGNIIGADIRSEGDPRR